MRNKTRSYDREGQHEIYQHIEEHFRRMSDDLMLRNESSIFTLALHNRVHPEQPTTPEQHIYKNLWQAYGLLRGAILDERDKITADFIGFYQATKKEIQNLIDKKRKKLGEVEKHNPSKIFLDQAHKAMSSEKPNIALYQLIIYYTATAKFNQIEKILNETDANDSTTTILKKTLELILAKLKNNFFPKSFNQFTETVDQETIITDQLRLAETTFDSGLDEDQLGKLVGTDKDCFKEYFYEYINAAEKQAEDNDDDEKDNTANAEEKPIELTALKQLNQAAQTTSIHDLASTKHNRTLTPADQTIRSTKTRSEYSHFARSAEIIITCCHEELMHQCFDMSKTPLSEPFLTNKSNLAEPMFIQKVEEGILLSDSSWENLKNISPQSFIELTRHIMSAEQYMQPLFPQITQTEAYQSTAKLWRNYQYLTLMKIKLLAAIPSYQIEPDDIAGNVKILLPALNNLVKTLTAYLLVIANEQAEVNEEAVLLAQQLTQFIAIHYILSVKLELDKKTKNHYLHQQFVLLENIRDSISAATAENGWANDLPELKCSPSFKYILSTIETHITDNEKYFTPQLFTSYQSVITDLESALPTPATADTSPTAGLTAATGAILQTESKAETAPTRATKLQAVKSVLQPIKELLPSLNPASKEYHSKNENMNLFQGNFYETTRTTLTTENNISKHRSPGLYALKELGFFAASLITGTLAYWGLLLYRYYNYKDCFPTYSETQGCRLAATVQEKVIKPLLETDSLLQQATLQTCGM